PAGADLDAFEAERAETAFAFGDLVRIERIEGAEPPVLWRARDDRGDLVVDRFHDVDGRRFRSPGDAFGRERIADDASGNAGGGADLLLQLEIVHLAVGDGRQA